MDICRLCLCRNQNLLIVTDSNELPLRIKHCVSVEINNCDNFPKTVCTVCIQKIEDWYNFKEMCISSNEQLKLRIEEQGMPNMNRETESTNEKFNNSTRPNCNENAPSNYDYEKLTEEYCNNEGQIEGIRNLHKCEVCSKEFDGVLEFLEHQDEHNGQPVFNCEKCKEVFSSRLDLAEHEKRHKKPCPECGKMVLKNSMKLHLIQHTDRYACQDCSHRFSSRATLRQHIITVHTNIKDHICEACGKRFSSKTAMNVHFKTHKEEREYTCKLCDYAGRTSSAIYIHMATHTNEIHSCNMCSKTFKSSRNLSDHLRRVHSKEKKHQCSYCSKKFVDRYMMMVHLRTHTGVRPYKCDLCEKAFIRSDSLKEHMVTHGSRIFYDCNQCMKKFTSKRGYTRHNCTISTT